MSSTISNWSCFKMFELKFFQTLLLIFSFEVILSLATDAKVEYNALEVIDKSPAELIRLRGFNAEIHNPKTRDGYHIHLVRIRNPKNVGEQEVSKRPVVFNHGLLESSTIWLINSRNVRPIVPPKACGSVIETKKMDFFNSTSNLSSNNSATSDQVDTIHLNCPMMLSNYGYDVWLMSMRGTDWSMRHEKYKFQDPDFWDYSLDDFALTDVPTVIDYIRSITNAPKIGYIGHSQATFSVFGLLSIRPRYADLIEPIIAVAPVSYMDNLTSVAKVLFLGALNSDMNGPFPTNARSMRKYLVRFCKRKTLDNICQFIDTIVSGIGKKAISGFYSHLPFQTSMKVLRHFGQLVSTKRNTMYDYGPKLNHRLYGSDTAPSYPTERIRSRSLCLISSESDALSPPKDVDRFRRRLTVPLYRDIKIEGDFNHMDMILNPNASKLVFEPILEIFESFEEKSGNCLVDTVTMVPNYNESESSRESDTDIIVQKDESETEDGHRLEKEAPELKSQDEFKSGKGKLAEHVGAKTGETNLSENDFGKLNESQDEFKSGKGKLAEDIGAKTGETNLSENHFEKLNNSRVVSGGKVKVLVRVNKKVSKDQSTRMGNETNIIRQNRKLLMDKSRLESAVNKSESQSAVNKLESQEASKLIKDKPTADIGFEAGEQISTGNASEKPKYEQQQSGFEKGEDYDV